ncbi:MAG TPA: hypothetical protein VGT79_01605, partial [Xanthomonadaceae bacterium]|nr:hypothetical protein [Xanthomonadaceae bacterium]
MRPTIAALLGNKVSMLPSIAALLGSKASILPDDGALPGCDDSVPPVTRASLGHHAALLPRRASRERNCRSNAGYGSVANVVSGIARRSNAPSNSASAR